MISGLRSALSIECRARATRFETKSQRSRSALGETRQEYFEKISSRSSAREMKDHRLELCGGRGTS
jgi:hypothetical protein